MSSGLKERLKRCGRYHSSPVAGQGSQRRSQFTSPLLPSSGKSDSGKSSGVNTCSIQNSVTSIENSDSGNLKKSLSTHSTNLLRSLDSPLSPDLDNKGKLQSNDSESSNAGLIRPQRLNFSQSCEKKVKGSESIETKEEDLKKSSLQSQLKEREEVLRKLRLVQFYQHKVTKQIHLKCSCSVKAIFTLE